MRKLLIINVCSDPIKSRLVVNSYFESLKFCESQILGFHSFKLLFNLDKLNEVESFFLKLPSEGIQIFMSEGTTLLSEILPAEADYSNVMIVEDDVFFTPGFLKDIPNIRGGNPCIIYTTQDYNHKIAIYDIAAVRQLNPSVSTALPVNPTNLIEGSLGLKTLHKVNSSSKPKILDLGIKFPLDGIIESYPVDDYTSIKATSVLPETNPINNASELYGFLVSKDIINYSSFNSKLFSIITPTHNIGEKLLETYESLKSQTYQEFEWILVNNSRDGGRTLNVLRELEINDRRIRVFNLESYDEGNIGNLKNIAGGLARGGFILELDHDDLLLPNCLETIYKASQSYPASGFFYSEGLEVDSNYNSLEKYPEGFSMGYGAYKEIELLGMHFDQVISSPINPMTIRHIVGVPNHVRVWKAPVYKALNGHNPYMRIADDYELLVRTFLITRFCKIPQPLYIQRFGENNSQDAGDNRNDIQIRVDVISKVYNESIKKRFEDLGVEDYVYPLIVEGHKAFETPPRKEDKYNVNYEYKCET